MSELAVSLFALISFALILGALSLSVKLQWIEGKSFAIVALGAIAAWFILTSFVALSRPM